MAAKKMNAKSIKVQTKTTKTAEPKKSTKVEVKAKTETKKATSVAPKKESTSPVKETKAPLKDVKKTVTKKEEPVKAVLKETTKAVKKEEAVKPVAKKTTTKKAVTKKTTATKKTVDSKAEVQPKKATAKKSVQTKTTKAKPVVKKPTKKELEALKFEQYRHFSLDTCIDMAHAMGIPLGYDDYASMLLETDDLNAIAKDLFKTYDLTSKKYTFEEDGYDADVVPVLLEKMSDVVEIKASDFAQLAKEIQALLKTPMDSNDTQEAYKTLFEYVKKYLMIGQRKDIHLTEDMHDLVACDGNELVVRFMDVAYASLPTWRYDDVKYYENFIYAVLSQFEDLYDAYANRAMMDVADLYIKHGDYALGDANYGYILRENQIKDYIYYRFAHVYQDLDHEKSRAIACDSLQYVDDRYTYYADIQKILED